MLLASDRYPDDRRDARKDATAQCYAHGVWVMDRGMVSEEHLEHTRSILSCFHRIVLDPMRFLVPLSGSTFLISGTSGILDVRPLCLTCNQNIDRYSVPAGVPAGRLHRRPGLFRFTRTEPCIHEAVPIGRS